MHLAQEWEMLKEDSGEGQLLMKRRLLPFHPPELPRVSLVPYCTQNHARKRILEKVV